MSRADSVSSGLRSASSAKRQISSHAKLRTRTFCPAGFDLARRMQDIAMTSAKPELTYE